MATDKKFEEMMQELEQISQDLEKGDLSLDESMKKFEEGIALSKKCCPWDSHWNLSASAQTNR